MGGASRAEAVAVLGECRIPLLLENLQQGLLDQSVDDTRHTTSELHSYPTDLWDRLKSRIRFIHCAGGGSSF
jgi:hypothetical protein